MVEASEKIRENAAAQAAVSKFFAPVNAIPIWKPRGGRGGAFMLWDDAFGDMLALIGLTHASILDEAAAAAASWTFRY